MKLYLSKSTIRLTICAAALLLSNRFCFADECPEDTEPTRPPEETLATQYQPYGTILHRYRFAPDPDTYPGPQYPTVLMLPPDVFNLEYGDEGVPSEQWATYDLQQAGFLVFQIDHRLAPPGALTGQLYSITSGRFPQQTDDVKRHILAALADPQCNGKIYLVGGSAGGCLALWVALDPSTGFPSFGWNEAARTSIKAVVSLSGIANLDNWENSGQIDEEEMLKFKKALCNYVGLQQNPPDHNHATLLAASPWNLVDTGVATSCPPVMLFATDGDTVPYVQATEMSQALKTRFGFTFEVYAYIMHYTETDPNRHAFKYWHSQNNADNSDGDCVSYQVTDFLLSHL